MQTGSDGFPIRTATMAKIFVQQGHYDKAIEIYRHLLKEGTGPPGFGGSTGSHGGNAE